MGKNRRYVPEKGVLHVMCRGNNKREVFHSDSDKLRYYSLIRELKEENYISIYHYCLMNNHVHMIVDLTPESDLARFMQQLNLSYFNYYKSIYCYCGHLWQGRYKSPVIETDQYFLQCCKYVELNPVRAGLVKSPGEYEFSSYNHYAHGKPDSLITDNPFFMEVSDDPKKRWKYYQEFVIDNEVMKRKFPKRGRPAKEKKGTRSLFSCCK